MKNTHEEVLYLLVKLQAFTKSNTPPLVFFKFFKLYKWYQTVQSVSYEVCDKRTSKLAAASRDLILF